MAYEHLASTLKCLPRKPGVYLYRDAKGRLLYIGEATILAQRVRSYFAPSAMLDPAKRLMVRRVTSIEYVITRSETEALLLETNLIKKHRPPFNILMKDDKSFLFVKIDMAEEYPRVDLVRRPTVHKGVRFFGPYTSARNLRYTLRSLKRVFPFRTCTNGPYDPCFDVHLGRCAGHTLAPGSRETYRAILQNVIAFLEGRRTTVLTDLERAMQSASETKDYERAAVLRDRLAAMKRIAGDSDVRMMVGENHDAVSLARSTQRSGGLAAVNLFVARGGKLLDKRTAILEHTADRSNADILDAFLAQYYAVATDIPKTILVQERPGDEAALEQLTHARLVVPRRGAKRKLIELGTINAADELKRREIDLARDTDRAELALTELRDALKLRRLPRRIEVYDISNIQGSFPVGSLIVFENGLSKRDAYRKFSIRGKASPDDPAMMHEMLVRRLKHAEDTTGKWSLPDLIIVDGGKGQLGAARQALRHTDAAIPLAALAKRDEELYLPGRVAPLRLPKRGEALLLLQRMRDEAHRFAIGFYRAKHRTEAKRSALDDVPGIGPAMKKRLLKAFGSVTGIRRAGESDIAAIVGKARAATVVERLGS